MKEGTEVGYEEAMESRKTGRRGNELEPIGVETESGGVASGGQYHPPPNAKPPDEDHR
jgi:hypothetical protein